VSSGSENSSLITVSWFRPLFKRPSILHSWRLVYTLGTK